MAAILTTLATLWSALHRKATWYLTRLSSLITTPPHLLLSPWYSYSPLHRSVSTIRLLHLHPGRGRLSVSLQAIPFDDSNKIEYEAVSYAWGDDTLRESVYCDGRRLDINASLYAALRHLRSQDPNDTPRVLWADAICINQCDINERGYQVALMGEIYSRPTGVLIWLGADTEGLSTVARSIDEVRAMLPPETYDAGELIRNSQDYYFAMSNLRKNGQKDRHFHHHNWTDINRLLLRPWFDRKWTIQEVLMAPATVPRTLISGDVELPWMKLASLGFVMASYGLTISASALSCLYGYPNALGSFYNQDLRPLRMLFNAQMVKVISFYQDRATLLDCVIATGMFASKDTRDQVFALLSLGSHDSSFQADYNKSPEEVLIDFAISTLVHDQNLKYLGLAPHRGFSLPDLPLPARLDLPSWVCDLAIPTLIDPLASYSIRDPIFHAGTSGLVRSDPKCTVPVTPSYRIRTSRGNKVLHLRGRIVDTITDFATCPNLVPFPTAEEILPWTGFTNQLRMRNRNWFWECQRLAFPLPLPPATAADEQDNVLGSEHPVPSPPREPLASMAAHPLTPSQAAQQAHYRSQHHARKQLFARTLLCDMIGMRDPIPIETLDVFVEYIDFMTDFFTHTKDYSFIQNEPERRDRMVTHGGLIEASLNGLTMGRKFCVTHEGRWGQVRIEAEKGDLICVVTGAEVPFVLRPIPSPCNEDDGEGSDKGLLDQDSTGGEGHQKNRYTLIGDCYLTEMMHGEALRDSRYEEVEIELE